MLQVFLWATMRTKWDYHFC